MRLRILVFALLVGCIAANAQNQDALTNETIIRMVASGVPTATVIKTIQVADAVAFRFLPGDLQQLTEYKVPDDVVKAMAAKNKAAPSVAVTQTPTSPANTSKPVSPPTAVSKPAVQQAPRTESLPALVEEPAPVSAQTKPRTRLGDIRTIYVDSLGNGEGADLLRERLRASLVATGRFLVVDTVERADAEIVGLGEIFRGSPPQTNVEAGPVNSTGSPASDVFNTMLAFHARMELERQRMLGVPILVIRLVDMQKNVLWAYDTSADSKREGVAKSLLKAISKEPKAKPQKAR